MYEIPLMYSNAILLLSSVFITYNFFNYNIFLQISSLYELYLLVLIVDVSEMLLYHRMHPIGNTFAQLFQTNMSGKALNCGISIPQYCSNIAS